MKDCLELYELWRKSCMDDEKKIYCKDLTMIINNCYRKYF